MQWAGSTWTSPRRWLAPGPIALFILACIVVAVAAADPELIETAGFLGMIVGMTAGGILYFRRSRKLEDRERRAWRFIGAAIILAAVGATVVGILTELGVEPPAFGPLDAFFVAGYMCLITGIIRMARLEGGGREWLPTLLDALVGAISLSVLVWTTMFRDLMNSLSGEGWQAVIAAMYPILDVAGITAVIILIIRRSHFHFDPRLMFLAAALTSQVIFDFIFLRRGVGVTFAEADPPWLLLLMASLLWVLGASIVDVKPEKREFPEVDVPLWAIAWPYLFGGALLAVHVEYYRSVAPTGDGVLILDAVLAVGILIFLRQIVAIRKNQQRVEKQRSELVASVSHELRTPLTAIVGYLHILDSQGEDFPEEARLEMLSEANEQAQHMSRLVSDLVMLARGVHRNLALEITEVPVSTLVMSALRGVDPEGKSVDVEIGSEVRARVDQVRIQQALTNLVSNAIRYGGDRAILSTRVDGTDLIFEMHDNGEGVPTRYEAVIWQRFERGANRLNSTTPGVGIGLAIVEAIVTSHGGVASYRRSEKLGGACFSIVLPGCVAESESPSQLVDANS